MTEPGSVVRAETLSVPKDFPTIQAAVNAAGPGDVVEIASGKYAEDVFVSGKTGLTIRGKGKVTWNADGFAGTALSFSSPARNSVILLKKSRSRSQLRSLPTQGSKP